MESVYPSLSELPLVVASVVEERCVQCYKIEKISLVALTFFGALTSVRFFVLGVLVGGMGYQVINGAVRRYQSHFAPLIKKWNKMELPAAVCVALVAIMIIKMFTFFLWASSMGAGVYVGMRLAKAYIANHPVLAHPHQDR